MKAEILAKEQFILKCASESFVLTLRNQLSAFSYQQSAESKLQKAESFYIFAKW
jgi:hypothetical protein